MGIRMKGQVFLLTAGVVIGVLVALKAFSTASQVTSERDILDVSLEDLAFKNMENEVKQIIVISSTTPNSITDNAIDFINFTRTGSKAQSLDLTALFVGVLANSTNQTMNITVFQFLRETNLNVTIRLNTSSEQTNSTLLNDSGIWTSNFTFIRGDGYNLTISLPGKSYQENVTFKTRGNKDVYVGFYDIRLDSQRATHISKFNQAVKIG